MANNTLQETTKTKQYTGHKPKKTDYDLYNKEFKERFMEFYSTNDKTKKNLSVMFERIAPTERHLKKDLYDFSYVELIDAFIGLDLKSKAAFDTKKSILNKYIEFAIDKGLVKSRINYVNNIVTKDYEKYLNKTSIKNRMITLEELKVIENSCENAQDAVLFRLLFEGLRGEGMVELSELKLFDVDIEDNRIHIKGKNERVLIPMLDDTIDMILEAFEQEQYEKNNGNIVGEMKSKHLFLYNSPAKYILKPRLLKKDQNETLTNATIMRRINTIIKVNSADVDVDKNTNFMKPTDIWVSGQLHYAKLLMENRGLTKEEDELYEMVNERFAYNDLSSTKERLRFFL